MICSPEDSFVLRNRVKMPCVGYGTYLEEGKEAYRSVATALRSGYRLIDTASLYKNEKEVGEAVGNFLRAGAAERSDLFITSKLWNADRGYDKTIAAFNKSLETLGLDYLDLYLIHWPANTRQFSPAEAKTLNQETWRALEDLYLSGRVRAIGVSNFLVHHLEDIYETARIEPMVDQIEFHPGWIQADILSYCRKKGIQVEAWSPLGRTTIFENKTICRIAADHGVGVAQVCLRFCLQHDVLPIPKSVHESRMKANLDLFGFTLTAEEMAALDGLANMGGNHDPDTVEF